MKSREIRCLFDEVDEVCLGFRACSAPCLVDITSFNLREVILNSGRREGLLEVTLSVLIYLPDLERWVGDFVARGQGSGDFAWYYCCSIKGLDVCLRCLATPMHRK